MADNETTILTTILLKRGTTEALNRVKPVLRYGEPGFEKDTNLLKIGNGEDPWPILPYLDSVLLTETDEQTGEITSYVTASQLAELFKQADDGAVLTKNNDNLDWIVPATSAADIAALINNSTTVQEAIATQVQNELNEKAIIQFQGPAISVEQDEITGENIVYILNNQGDMVPAATCPGDVYTYNGIEYIFDNNPNVNGWIPIGESQTFDPTQDFVTQNELIEIQKIINENANTVATTDKLGLVKSSVATNQITVENDGTMTINAIGIHKLVNVPGWELILDGGEALPNS